MRTNSKAETIRQLILKFPVEIGLSIAMAITFIAAIEPGGDIEEFYFTLSIALAISVAWWINRMTRNSCYHWIYYISWIPAITITTLFEYSPMTEIILCNLFLTLAFSSRDNRLFAPMQLGLAIESIVVSILSQIAFLLMTITVASVDYLFKTEITKNVFIYAIAPISIIGAMALFLYRTEIRDKSIEAKDNRALSILSNYILSPAIIAYAAVIYVYIASIIIKWELPEGNISVMILSFTTIYFAARAIGENSASKIFKPLYKHISLIALPMQIMLWMAITRRVADYGLTEWRIILIVAAAITLVALLTINSQRYGRYHYILGAITAAALLLSIKSPISPREISLQSQSEAAYELAQQMEILDNNDKVNTDLIKIEWEQIEDIERLRSTIKYVGSHLNGRDRSDYLWFFDKQDHAELNKIVRKIREEKAPEK